MRRSPQASFSPGDLPTQLPQLLLRSSPDPSPWASALPQLYFCLWTCSSPPVSFLASLDGSQQLSQCPTELAKGIPTLSSQHDALEQFPSTPFLMSAADGNDKPDISRLPSRKNSGNSEKSCEFWQDDFSIFGFLDFNRLEISVLSATFQGHLHDSPGL